MDEAKVQELQAKLAELKDELRTHSGMVDNPRCAALCETSAEVIGGLETAFDHFLNRSEPAWQDQ